MNCRTTTKYLALVAVALLLTTAGATAHDQVPSPPQEAPILLKGGDLYTVSDGVLQATDLLFVGGQITAIGENLEAPEGAEVVDVSGSRVYPGLIAPQTSIGLVEVSAVRATRDTTEVGGNTPEVAAHIAYNPDSEIIPTVRSHGVTTVQSTPRGSFRSAGNIPGRTFITHLDGWTKEDAGVRLVDGLQVNWPRAGVINAWWMRQSAEEQRKELSEQREALRDTFDRAKAYHAAKAADEIAVEDLRWEAMLPVFDGEMPVYVIANDYRQIGEAVAFSQEYGLEIILVGGEDAYMLTELLRDADVPVILNQATGLPNREGDDYDIKPRTPALLKAAGVRFSIAMPGGDWNSRNLALEGGQAVGGGLSPADALRAMTLTTAEILGVEDTLGSLEVGKEATLFVSTGDVMDALTQDVTRMYIRGRSVDLNNRHRTLYKKYGEKIQQMGGN